MPLMLEDYLQKIGQSGASPDDQKLMLRTLAEKGLLQNAPSQRFSPEESTTILQSLTDKGVIPQLGTTPGGEVALPSPTPETDRLNAQTAPTTAPGVPAQATPAAPAGGDTPTPEAPGGVSSSTLPGAPLAPTEEETFYDKLASMGTGALQTVANTFSQGATPDQVSPVNVAKKGYEYVKGLAKPENLEKVGSDFVAPNVGEVLGGIGGAAVGSLAGPVGTAAGYVVGSGLGAGAGLVVGRKATGEDVTLKEVGVEGAISFLPEFLETSARSVLNYAAKTAPKAQKIVENLMAKWASTDAAKVFDPPSKEKVDNLFALVHQSNVKVKGDNLTTAIAGFDTQQWNRLKNELEGIGTQRYGAQFGGEMAETFDKIRGGAKGVEMNIGHIQDLRSQMLKKINMETPTADDLAKKGLVDTFDREIDKMLVEGSADAKLLKEAREQWGRYKAADTLQAFVSKPPVSRYDRAMENMSFDLSHLGQVLREPANKVQEQIARDLKVVPGAEDAFKEWLGKMQGKRGVIEVSTTGLTMNQLMGVPVMIGNILVSVRGREAIEKVLTTTRGPLDLNKISLAYNAARRATDIGTSGQVGSLEGVGTQGTALGAMELPGMKKALGMQNY